MWTEKETVLLLRMISLDYDINKIIRNTNHNLKQIKKKLKSLGISTRSYFNNMPEFRWHPEPKRKREYQRIRQETKREAQHVLYELGYNMGTSVCNKGQYYSSYDWIHTLIN